MKISFVGLGKLGCCMFASLAKHYEVVGIDINEHIIKSLQEGKSPYPEPELQELLNTVKNNITVTNTHEAVKDTDVTFIMVPTPSDENGGFSSEYVEQAILEVGRNISDEKEYHLIVVCSTLIPGTMEETIRPLLEQASNRIVGDKKRHWKTKLNGKEYGVVKKPIGLCYNPEFMALGNVIHDFNYPEFIIIGESDKRAGDLLEEIYQKIAPINESADIGFNEYGSFRYTPLHRMSLYNAELAKIANNAYVAMKMSFANTIGEICEGMPTGNATHVLNALGDDSRIGNRYLQAGLSFGGPCYPRDSRAFTYTANKYGIRAHIAEMIDVVNIEHINRVVSKILQILSKKGTNKISILGVTYKPDTIVVEESASMKIIEKLIAEGIIVTAYDPSISLELLPLPGLTYRVANSVQKCLEYAEVVFIATPWNEFKNLTKNDFKTMKEHPVVIDAWGIQKQLSHDTEIEYHELGVN